MPQAGKPKRFTDFDGFYFSDWIRNNLPHPNTGLCISDCDVILYNYKSKKLLLIEVKCQGRTAKPFQKHLFNMLNRCLHFAIPTKYPDFDYLGFHFLQFENDTFENGRVYWDRIEITEAQLIEKLSI